MVVWLSSSSKRRRLQSKEKRKFRKNPEKRNTVKQNEKSNNLRHDVMKTSYMIIFLILLMILLNFYFYPSMPDKVATHWDANGQVNGYMPKFWSSIIFPGLSVFFLLLFIAIPKMDPLKRNIIKFSKYYEGFIVLIFIFLLYINILSIAWNIGVAINMIIMLFPALGILFYAAGILTENAKRNWSIGIRTPWTLSNEKVWSKTNKLGGKLFKASGIITLFGIVFQDYALYFILSPILFSAIYLIFYSYLEYKKLKR